MVVPLPIGTPDRPSGSGSSRQRRPPETVPRRRCGGHRLHAGEPGQARRPVGSRSQPVTSICTSRMCRDRRPAISRRRAGSVTWSRWPRWRRRSTKRDGVVLRRHASGGAAGRRVDQRPADSGPRACARASTLLLNTTEADGCSDLVVKVDRGPRVGRRGDGRRARQRPMTQVRDVSPYRRGRSSCCLNSEVRRPCLRTRRRAEGSQRRPVLAAVRELATPLIACAGTAASSRHSRPGYEHGSRCDSLPLRAGDTPRR